MYADIYRQKTKIFAYADGNVLYVIPYMTETSTLRSTSKKKAYRVFCTPDNNTIYKNGRDCRDSLLNMRNHWVYSLRRKPPLQGNSLSGG